MRRLAAALALAALLPAGVLAQTGGKVAPPAGTAKPPQPGKPGRPSRPCSGNVTTNCYRPNNPYYYGTPVYVYSSTPAPSGSHQTAQHKATPKPQNDWGGQVFSSISTNPH